MDGDDDEDAFGWVSRSCTVFQDDRNCAGNGATTTGAIAVSYRGKGNRNSAASGLCMLGAGVC